MPIADFTARSSGFGPRRPQAEVPQTRFQQASHIVRTANVGDPRLVVLVCQ